jgi:hypothetical protein
LIIRVGPLGVIAVRLRHVLGVRGVAAAHVAARGGRHPAPLLEDLHRRRRVTDIDADAALVRELEGDRVVVPLDVDVVVEVDARVLPLAEDEACRRQRPQRRAIDPREELTSALAVPAHHAIV